MLQSVKSFRTQLGRFIPTLIKYVFHVDNWRKILDIHEYKKYSYTNKKSISGLCTNRLEFGFESTEFGYKTNGQETTMSTKRPDTIIISLRAGLQLGVESNTNTERTSAIHQKRKETGDKLVEMVDLMAVLGLLPVPLCSHFHSFIYLFACFVFYFGVYN